MCEKRIKKIKKGSGPMNLQAALRLHRLQRVNTLSPPPPTSLPVTVIRRTPPAPPKLMDKGTQTKVMLHLAWRTIVLVHRNTLIQQKMAALHKETSDYVEAVMSIPENRQKYFEKVRLYGTEAAQQYFLRIMPRHRVQTVKTEPAESQQ